MKALVLKEYGRFVLDDVPVPDVAANEALVKVKACGICGSDVHGMDGSTGRRRPPIVMGHEAAGVIAQVGPGVRGWKEGERVTFDSTVYCGECWFCRRGDVNLCDNRRVLGVSCDEYRRHGAFAEYVAVPQHILYRLPDGVSFEQAAMIEPLAVAVHGVNLARIKLNDTVVAVGTGIIGLLALQAARVVGAGKIIAVDLETEKLDTARRLGADVGLKADACNVAEEVKKLSDGRGADVALEAVGIAPTVKTGVQCLRKGGTLVLIGNLSPTVELPLQTCVTRQVTLIGSCAFVHDYPACIELIAQRKVNVDALISAVAPLAEGPRWFERLHGKEPGLLKVILVP
ncbi:MAG: galactitol-1-phosphate 5-dehydrogenase [Planctomycetes bacterium]|nr:galactitol-1-phosphate 5-dehydrogenase [Planctomycetota bacterium]